MSKHTPGPWNIASPNLSMTAHSIVAPSVRQMDRLSCVAHIDIQYSDEEEQANARLIAAAPKMLEALKAADRFLFVRTDLPTSEASKAARLVRAAISKAEGRDV